MILVGDLNVAPLEHDVWSHKQMMRVVSHTPIECEKLRRVPESRGLGRCHAHAGAGACEAVHVVELSLAGLEERPTRVAGWTTSGLPLRSRTGSRNEVLKDSRGWRRPSDHVPVTATLEL